MRYVIMLCWLLIIFVSNSLYSQEPIISPSDPSVTTHYLQSGTLKLGINNNAGGAINYLELPGIGNIFGPQSITYGRMGQSAMRDGLHGGKFNPTQAGFNETLGTPCTIDVSAEALTVIPRNCALWYGDGKYDYIEWENLGTDPYGDDGGNSDVDGIDESSLSGKQDTELRSEFDYFGKYINYMNKGGINIPCIRHYYEYRFIRTPGHCLSQFAPGTPIFDSTKFHGDISTKYPKGIHKAEPNDMSYFLSGLHIRHDVANWDPEYRFSLDENNNWIIENREGVYRRLTKLSDSLNPYMRFFVISNSNDPDVGPAMGIYMPYNDYNNYNTIGVNETNGKIVYKDMRGNDAGTYRTCRNWDSRYRIPTMSLWGFKLDVTGLLNRTRLDPNVYEAFRNDTYILMGTPNEIYANIQKLHQAKYSWHFINSLENWTLDKSLTGSASSSILNLNITGSDPFMNSPNNLLVDADLQRFMVIRMKNNTAATGAAIYFWTYDTDIAQHITFPVTGNDTEYKTYIIDMQQNPAWTGMVKQIRFDPAGTSGNLNIDYISIRTNDILVGTPVLAEPANNQTEIPSSQLFAWHKVNSAEAYQLQISSSSDFSSLFKDLANLTDTVNTVKQFDYNTTYYWRVRATNAGGYGQWSDVYSFTTQGCWPEGQNWLMNRFAGWNTTHSAGIGNLAINSGILSYDVLNGDPYISSVAGLGCCAANNPHVKIRIKNNTPGTVGSVYFNMDGDDSWVGNFVSKSISANDADFKEYTFDMSSHAGWTGTINQLRLDLPNNADTGSVEIDYIQLGDFSITGYKSSHKISEYKRNSIQVSPNPPVLRLTLTAKDSENPELTIYNIQGKKVLRCKMEAVSESRGSILYEAELTEISAGIYYSLIKIDEDNRLTGKICITGKK